MYRTRHGFWVWLGVVSLFGSTSLGASEPGSSAAPRDAEPLDAVIEIERAAGSEACPNSESVFRAIERLFPERAFRPSTGATVSAATAHVAIRPLSPGYEAVLTVLRPRRGERVILEKDEDCRGLADALALAFVMLVEPDAKAAPAASAAPAPASASAAPPQPIRPRAEARKAAGAERLRNDERAAEPARRARESDVVRSPRWRSLHADLEAAAVGGIGLLSEPALGAVGGLELLEGSGLGISLQGIRLWSGPAEAQGGSVTLTLWGLLLGPCFRGRLSKISSVEAGLLLGIGSQFAKVKGFAEPRPGSFPWMVLAPTLGYRLTLAAAARAFARIGPVIQLRPQSFSVRLEATGENSQIAAAPNVGVMAELGVAFGGDFSLMPFANGG
jgi:hypothetical protein